MKDTDSKDDYIKYHNVTNKLLDYAFKCKDSFSEMFAAAADEIVRFEHEVDNFMPRGSYCPSLLDRVYPFTDYKGGLYLSVYDRTIVCGFAEDNSLISVKKEIGGSTTHEEFIIHRFDNMIGLTYRFFDRKLVSVCDTVLNGNRIVEHSTGEISFNENNMIKFKNVRIEEYSIKGNDVEVHLISLIEDTEKIKSETIILKDFNPLDIDFGRGEENKMVQKKSDSNTNNAHTEEFISYLYDKTLSVVKKYAGFTDVYALTFVVDDSAIVSDREGLMSFTVDCARESDCPATGKYSEERWNYAYWSHENEAMLIDPWDEGEGWERYQRWLKATGLDAASQDERLLKMFDVASEVGLRLQKDTQIEKMFKNKIPIIIHDLEYWDAPENATKKANPKGEADVFLEAFKRDFT